MPFLLTFHIFWSFQYLPTLWHKLHPSNIAGTGATANYLLWLLLLKKISKINDCKNQNLLQ